MKLKSSCLLFIGLVLIATLLVSVKRTIPRPLVSQSAILPGTERRFFEAFGKLPLRFEANRGQTDPEVKFLSRGPGYGLFLTSTEAVIHLQGTEDKRQTPQSGAANQGKCGRMAACLPLRSGKHRAGGSEKLAASKIDSVLRMHLVGAKPDAIIRGIDRLPGASNYYIGTDPARWRTAVPAYAKVGYQQIYPGIDLVYYGNPNQLEYDFLLSPGANPDAIRLDIDGADRLDLDDRGDLVIGVAGQQVRLQTPVIYQEAEGKRQRVAGHYVRWSDRQVGFQLSAYDSSRPLTIDPVLIYSSYLGGSGDENSPNLASTYGASGGGIAVDGNGNAYLTGYTTSTDFPTTNGAAVPFQGGSDVYVVKIDPTGSTLLYSSFLGGDGDQDALGIAVDPSGNAYITGFTSSNNFPTTPGAYRIAPYTGTTDAFVTKVNASGTVGYSTYLGGNDLDIGYGIAVDSGGNAYVTGVTGSTNFPSNGYQRSIHGQYNGFVAKFNATGSSLAYSTYLGGKTEDIAVGIAVDSGGNAYITGQTVSTDFPVTSSAFSRRCGSDGSCNPNSTTGLYFDSFVTKLNAGGSALVYSTFLGGSADDTANGIAVDSSGNAYVTGTTSSPDFPVTSGAFQTSLPGNSGNAVAFVTKLNAAGSGLVYSTYLGGTGGNSAVGIAVDSSGSAYVAGTTSSADFPLAGNPFQSSYGGQDDAFVSKLDPAGAKLSYSTYLGGSLPDLALGIAVDSAGNAYVTGVTASSDFPTANPFQSKLSGVSDAFLVKIRDSSSGGPLLSANSVVNGASFAPMVAVAPGSIASVFGTGLASPTSDRPNLLAPGLAAVVLTMNGIQAPLYYVSATQINFQVPWELAGQSQANLTVTVDGIPSSRVAVSLADFGPGIFTLTRTDGSNTQGAVLISNSSVYAAPAGTIAGATSRPANRGEFITIYCTGLGAVSNQPPTGVAASASPLSSTATTTAVTLLGQLQLTPGVFGDVAAPVSFAGLTPGFFGLYQIDAQIPQTALTGVIPLKVIIGGQTSNTVMIAVQ